MSRIPKEHAVELRQWLDEYNVVLRFKSDGYDTWFHKIVGLLGTLFFTFLRILSFGSYKKRFVDFNTQIGRYMYLTDTHRDMDFQDPVTHAVIRHELIHRIQWEKLGALRFVLHYYVLPLPTVWTWRANMELEAYTQDLMITHYLYGRVPDTVRDAVVNYFTGGAYFFMRPFRKKVEKEIDARIEDIAHKRIKGLWPHYPAAFPVAGREDIS